MSLSKVTEAISKFIVETSFDHLPPQVLAMAKRSLLDWIAVTLGAATEPAAKILIDFIEEIDGKKQASILGHGLKTTMLNAALVNGATSHILDYDDAHSVTRNHTSAPLVPALLAVAEHKGLNGRDLLAAYIVGFDVSTRIGLALGKRYYEDGWHATSILGRFGAAAAVSRLLGLSTLQVMNALGLAATQAAGIRSVFGTMGKPFHAGKAAMDGMMSAMLAGRDFTGPIGILDDDSEFVRIFSAEYDSGKIGKDLGKEYYILTNTFKMHAACLLLHPGIDGLLALKKEYGLNPEDIESIELEVAPLCLSVTDNPTIVNATEGKFSLYFCAAQALVGGKVGSGDFTDAAVNDPAIRELMQKVRVKTNSSMKETETNVVVQSSSWKRYTEHVAAFRGDPDNPLSYKDIEEKFRGLNAGFFTEERMQAIVTCIRNFDKLANISGFTDLCRFI